MFAQIARDAAIMTKFHAQDIDYHHAGCRSVTLNYPQYFDIGIPRSLLPD